jgi:hypothetical protein
VFDSAALVSLGSGASPGTLDAANGLALDLGGNITGYRVVSASRPVDGNVTLIVVTSCIVASTLGIGSLNNQNQTQVRRPFQLLTHNFWLYLLPS